MHLYHFTNLLNLPDVLRDGITKGEVPVSPGLPYNRVPQAANLTTNGNPKDQELWTLGSRTDKTKVRLLVDVPAQELTSFRQIKERYRIPSKWLNQVAPYNARIHWHFAFGGVRPDQIKKVEVLEDGQYRTLTAEAVGQLVARIEDEIAEKLVLSTVPHGFLAGARQIGFKPGHFDTWLFDASEFRSDRSA